MSRAPGGQFQGRPSKRVESTGGGGGGTSLPVTDPHAAMAGAIVSRAINSRRRVLNMSYSSERVRIDGA